MSMMVMYNIGDFYLFAAYPLEVEKICTIPQEKREKVRGNNVKRALYPRCVFSGEWYASGYSQNEKTGGELYGSNWKRDRRLWNVISKVKRTQLLKIQELSLFFSK